MQRHSSLPRLRGVIAFHPKLTIRTDFFFPDRHDLLQTINPAPTAPISIGNITKCEVSPIQTLNANDAIVPISGINITWYDAPTLGNIVANPTLNTVGTITYYAEGDDGICPSLTRIAVTLTIDPAPTAPIST